MSRSIVIELPEDIDSALDQAAREEGVSSSELMVRAVKRYLFLRQFRRLRVETLAHLRMMGEDELTDEEVFRMIS